MDPYFTVLGIDPSLTGCGVAIISAHEGGRTWDTETFGRKGSKTETLTQRLERIIKLRDQVREYGVTGAHPHPDIALIETPAHGNTTGSHHDRSGLWWMIVHMLDQAGIEIVEVTPSQVKKYALGKGVGSKDEVMAAAIRRYPDAPIANNNESDAWILAAMGARLIGNPIEESLPKSHIDTLEKVNRG